MRGDPIDAAPVFALLAGLVAQSLVVAERDGPDTRYRLLETIREYGEERLAEHDETARLRQSHAEHFVVLGSELSDQMVGPRWVEIGNRFASERENFLSAMAWAIDNNDADLAFRLLRAVPGAAVQIGFTLWLPADAVLELPDAGDHPDYPFALAVAANRAAERADRERCRGTC